MEGTEWKDDLCGSPQGSVISPILANIYLHYVLDLWFDRKWRKQTAQGEAVLIRYADDFVAGFETRRDAEQFRSDLEQRLNKFGLALHPDKTRCIEFGRYAMANRRARAGRNAVSGVPKPSTSWGSRIIAGPRGRGGLDSGGSRKPDAFGVR